MFKNAQFRYRVRGSTRVQLTAVPQGQTVGGVISLISRLAGQPLNVVTVGGGTVSTATNLRKHLRIQTTAARVFQRFEGGVGANSPSGRFPS
jgi:hypothetical protein